MQSNPRPAATPDPAIDISVGGTGSAAPTGAGTEFTTGAATGPNTAIATGAGSAADRRPRIAIMGEFSAGKSTLTNLLLAESALPTRVTATQLPPVWLSHGEGPSYAETLDGTRFEVDLADPGRIDVAHTRFLRVFRRAPILNLCDLIDFPGISDPNMDADVWQRLVPLADAVLWCTHATQAWRQTEAAVWEGMPHALREVSLLLLTRMDRVPEDRDLRRVVARVARETKGLFAGICPVSLTRGLAAQNRAAEGDRALWAESGAAALMEALHDLIDGLRRPAGRRMPRPDRRARPDGDGAAPRPERAVPMGAAPGEGAAAARVLPRRVRPAIARKDLPGPGDSGANAPDPGRK